MVSTQVTKLFRTWSHQALYQVWNYGKDSVEMVIEVFVENNDLTFVENIKSIEGVKDLTLIQYNGEYHG